MLAKTKSIEQSTQTFYKNWEAAGNKHKTQGKTECFWEIKH